MSLKCKLGWHDWLEGTMSGNFNGFESKGTFKVCLKCKLLITKGYADRYAISNMIITKLIEEEKKPKKRRKK